VAGGLSAAEPWEVVGVSELFFVSFSSMETALVSTKGRESRAESHGSAARLLVLGTEVLHDVGVPAASCFAQMHAWRYPEIVL